MAIHTCNQFAALSIMVILASALVGSCSKPTPNARVHTPAALPELSFAQSADVVDVFGFLEVTITIPKPTAQNPFTEVFVTGRFETSGADGPNARSVDGFCDSADGSAFRIRFMPTTPGPYTYSVTYWEHNLSKVQTGTFRAIDAKRRGLLAVDPVHPWHFIWKGTGEHYFLNGTTAFLLMGWTDEKIIQECIRRLRRFEINRIRVLLDGRTDHFWTEPVRPTSLFHAHLEPWLAGRPDSIDDPEFDFSRFNVSYWKKFERMLEYARDRDVIISVILAWSVAPVHPVAGSEDERRYLRYAVARLGAFSNVTWDLGDDLDSFRDEPWTHATGEFLREIDAYQHLATSHPASVDQPQDRSAAWFGMTSFQYWKRPLHAWMLQQRKLQSEAGRIVPQVNEEYGYEDHYPKWAPYSPPAASADSNRRAAWEMTMAGGYQTTGETAKRGTGIAPDTGGGWVNGRGDETMKMLDGYMQIMRFFEKFQWWLTQPSDELVDNGAFCLSDPGNLYVIYLPNGGSVDVELELGRYNAQWFNPRSGEYSSIPPAEGPRWRSPSAPDTKDWALLLTRVH